MKIIIAGAGFAGLRLARALSNKPGFDILLIDRFNYHQFQPLFYQVATAGLDASNISFPLRKMFHRCKNVRIRMADILTIDNTGQKLITDIGEFDYDKLILATGADTNYFGNQNLATHTMPMKSTVEALRIRHQLIHNFEDALEAPDEEALRKLMTVVVVGGGPTGVEMSGAIAEMKTYVLPKDYPDLDFGKMRIILVEGTAKTLGTMSEKSSAESAFYLQKLGVEVQTNLVVKDYDGHRLQLSDGNFIDSNLVIWAAGIKGNVPAGIDPLLIVRGNRIKVDRYNQVENTPNVYAIGDIACMITPRYPNGHPQVANVAISQADNLGTNLLNAGRGATKKVEYEYNDKGSMATVGRNLAVVDIPDNKKGGTKMHFKGFFAWLIWMGLHLFLLVGVKNRIQVFVNWIYNYLTYDQSLRLIFKEFYKHPINSNTNIQNPDGAKPL